MTYQGMVLKRVLCFCMMFMIPYELVVSSSSAEQDTGFTSRTAHDTRTEQLPVSSIHSTNEILKPSQIRNRRSNLLTENEQFVDDNPGIDSAFLYSDQIMQNLLKTHSPRPLNYARSNFFLNLLKPRTTRYNAWDDHSLMHFGKRSLESDVDSDRTLVKRSVDVWSPNNVLHFGKKFESSSKTKDLSREDIDISNFQTDKQIKSETTSSEIPWIVDLPPEIGDLGKKSADPWHSMMSFGKKSENPKDDNSMDLMDKKSDPWHNMMSFGKKSDPWHSMMSFGKRAENLWDHSTLQFGKRDDPWHNMMSFGKRDEPWHNIMSFGKRNDPWHSMMSFGKKSDPWHSIMSFGKKSDNAWDHNTLHFGKRNEPSHNEVNNEGSESTDMTDLDKRDDPWHNMMSFGKKSIDLEKNNTKDTDKRVEPWHNMINFGKKYDSDFGEHFTMHFGKRDEPWHSMMSFGKRSDLGFDHNTLHFGKREDPWHNMMSFGKRENLWDHNTMHFGKREEPWHDMMSFGKRDNDWDHNTLHFGKKDEPWHNMMSFGKRDNPWDHSTLHFGKREDPWHNMMSFGKRDTDWDHNTLHFGKKDEPWHNMMSFGKRDSPWDHNTLHFGKRDEPWHSMMSFGKRQDLQPNDDLMEDFEQQLSPWEEYNGMIFYKKSNPWDDDTLHFGKKSNNSLNHVLTKENEVNAALKHVQKRSVDMLRDHHTMHFGKKADPWESYNTMHFGKKSDHEELENMMNIENKFDWDHNTLHFGKKRDPWDYHNTMHFGKRNPWEYHNTMHFGKKRDPWDYHNTMHFGKKRDSWDYHNTLHFGKRSDSGLKNNKQSEMDTEQEKNDEDGKGDAFKTFKRLIGRPSKILNEVSTKKSSSSTFSDKHDVTPATNEEQIFKPNSSEHKYQSKNENESVNLDNISKPRIHKRSIEAPFNKALEEYSANAEPNTEIFEEFSKNDFPDSVLHFGKRSVDDSEYTVGDDEDASFDGAAVKKFDEYLNNHNTMHFGKKSNPWEGHGTLHFGKKSDPWDSHSTMHFGKRDPWEYHNTLHFGKKFDPWEGHAKMHFGKRTEGWDHNVMHFGKKDISPSDLQDTISAGDFLNVLLDQSQLKSLLYEKNSREESIEEDKELLESLMNLENMVNSRLEYENLPLDEKFILLKTYLKPLLKVILGRQLFENAVVDYVDDSTTEDLNSNDITERRDEILNSLHPFPGKIINDNNYEDLMPNENNEVLKETYDENSKGTDYLSEYNNYLKSKRNYVEKPGLKRYFGPFQGPKSIVYPHAWFASQIRRSSLPRTAEYARNMQMRMAEKKEDPFNSYMHFGRR